MDADKLLDRLRFSCSRREYCSSDIMKKAVTALDGDREAAQKIVASLIEEKYVDDLRYASAFARDKSSIAGWGEVKIRQILSSKGVARETIAAALREIDGSKASGKLRKLLEVKARSLKGDPQIRMKLLRFALGRGYEYDDVSRLIPDLLRNLIQDDTLTY